MQYFPKFLTTQAQKSFFVIFAIISILAFRYFLPVIWTFFAIITVLLFFNYSYKFSVQWKALPELIFRKKLLYSAFFIRISWVTISYILYSYYNGDPFEFRAADAYGYHEEAKWMVNVIKGGYWDTFWAYYLPRLSDMGYPVYLTFIYYIFGDSIIIARIFKAILSSFTVLFIYKIATRNFGVNTGRLAGIIAMLFPNLIYYTGLHVKETEMVFLTLLFIERADLLLRQSKIKINLFLFTFLVGISLYFFRAVLTYSTFFALFSVTLFSKSKIFKSRQKLSVIFIISATIIFTTNNILISEAAGYWDKRTSNQERSLSHRTATNKLAKYGSALVFAPIIITAPFPTFVNIDYQKNHMLMSGGYFVKNIMAFFVLSSLFYMIKQKYWKNHFLIISFFISYLAILALSKFAIVERFHMPIIPIHIILAAHGISLINKKNFKYFRYYLIGIGVIIIGWNWFKLAGRGLI